mgnify:FL=1
MESTLQESEQAMEKMNYIADKMIFAGYCIVGCLASYATYKILTKWLIKPFASTYRFLTNQSRDVGGRSHWCFRLLNLLLSRCRLKRRSLVDLHYRSGEVFKSPAYSIVRFLLV